MRINYFKNKNGLKFIYYLLIHVKNSHYLILKIFYIFAFINYNMIKNLSPSKV